MPYTLHIIKTQDFTIDLHFPFKKYAQLNKVSEFFNFLLKNMKDHASELKKLEKYCFNKLNLVAPTTQSSHHLAK